MNYIKYSINTKNIKIHDNFSILDFLVERIINDR